MMYFKRLTGLVGGLVILGLAACAPASPVLPEPTNTPTAAPANLANTNWQLISFSEAGVEKPVLPGSTITLEFGSEGQAGGSAGCNGYGAQYEVQGDTVAFEDIVRTLMACVSDGVDEQENRYLHALETAARFELAGDQLRIWYGDGQGVLNLEKYAAAGTPTPQVTTAAVSTEFQVAVEANQRRRRSASALRPAQPPPQSAVRCRPRARPSMCCTPGPGRP